MPSGKHSDDCVTVVLAQEGASGTPPLSAEALAALNAARAGTGPIELFCALAAAPGEGTRIHPPTADLATALAVLHAADADTEPRDVVWIVAGTEAAGGWDARLLASLRSDPMTGTVSPLCAANPLYSPLSPSSRQHPPGAILDAWLREHQSSTPVQMPTPLRLCGAISARAVQAVLEARTAAQDPQDAERWARAVSAAGLVHAACLSIAVVAPAQWAAAAAESMAPGSGASLLGLEGPGRSHPLIGLRETLELPIQAQPGPARPVRLHLSHSWGGGLGLWVQDFCRADDDHEGLVLRPIGGYGAFGSQLALYHGSDAKTPLRSWELDLPIHATALAHTQYRAILQEIISDFGVDTIVVSSLIGQSLDALRTALPTLIVAHDHMPLCVTLYASFQGSCTGCDAGRLAECIARNPAHVFFRGVRADDWTALRNAFAQNVLSRGLTIVAPTPSTAARWQALIPALTDARFEVIPHGIDLAPAPRFSPPSEGPLRLVKLGRLSEEKGAALLEAVLPELLQFAEITLLGCGRGGERFARHPGVTVVPHYAREELGPLLAQARPHLGLQLSVVPETFSYTLSELWHHGVPVLACSLGSLADRIREGENGYLCAPTPQALLARLREINAARGALTRISAHLQAMPQRSCAQMVADYRRLLPPPARHPLGRASLARRDNGRRLAVGPLAIDHQAGYAQVAKAFVRYTIDKATGSRRLPGWLRRLLGRASAGRKGQAGELR